MNAPKLIFAIWDKSENEVICASHDLKLMINGSNPATESINVYVKLEDLEKSGLIKSDALSAIHAEIDEMKGVRNETDSSK